MGPAWYRRSKRATAVHGRVDLVVNAAPPYGGDRSGRSVGAYAVQAPPDAFQRWAAGTRSRRLHLSLQHERVPARAGRSCRPVVQVTGGSARRAMPGRGLWAAGSFGVRALTNAAALELKDHGIHVALLIVGAGIEPLDGSPPGQATESLAGSHRSRSPSVPRRAGRGSATNELQVTPLAERWVPEPRGKYRWTRCDYPTRYAATVSGSRYAADGLPAGLNTPRIARSSFVLRFSTMWICSGRS